MNARLWAIQFVGGPSDGEVLTGIQGKLHVPAGDEVVHLGPAPGDEPVNGWIAAYHLKCQIEAGQLAHLFRYDFAGYRRQGQRNVDRGWRSKAGEWLSQPARRLAMWMLEPIDYPFNYHRAGRAMQVKKRS